MVEPKRMQLNAAKSQLDEKQAALAEAQSKLREVPRLRRPQPLPPTSLPTRSVLTGQSYGT